MSDPSISARRRPAPPRARSIHDLEDPEQLQAIASPPRQRLVAALEALGPASVRELAAHLGRSPQSLYFHLRKLHLGHATRIQGSLWLRPTCRTGGEQLGMLVV